MKSRHAAFVVLLSILLASCAPSNTVNFTMNTMEPESTAVASVEPNPPPAWLTVPMTDAQTGDTFTVADLKSKVVLVEGMATWCPTCWAQANELKSLKQKLNAGDDFVIVSLALDLKEDASVLKEYAATGGYDWLFVTSTMDLYRDIGTRYGATYLDPTLVPLFIVDKEGGVQNFRKGKIPSAELEDMIKPLLEA
jgi:cytochrome oxidase Cu insertion factor (SCO1/SenC/PrrC family)